MKEYDGTPDLPISVLPGIPNVPRDAVGGGAVTDGPSWLEEDPGTSLTVTDGGNVGAVPPLTAVPVDAMPDAG